MNYNNFNPVNSIYLVDIYSNEYIVKDVDKYEVILHTFKHLKNVNSSIQVTDSKGKIKLIEAKKIQKVYSVNKNFINIQIFKSE